MKRSVISLLVTLTLAFGLTCAFASAAVAAETQGTILTITSVGGLDGDDAIQTGNTLTASITLTGDTSELLPVPTSDKVTFTIYPSGDSGTTVYSKTVPVDLLGVGSVSVTIDEETFSSGSYAAVFTFEGANDWNPPHAPSSDSFIFQVIAPSPDPVIDEDTLKVFNRMQLSNALFDDRYADFSKILICDNITIGEDDYFYTGDQNYSKSIDLNGYAISTAQTLRVGNGVTLTFCDSSATDAAHMNGTGQVAFTNTSPSLFTLGIENADDPAQTLVINGGTYCSDASLFDLGSCCSLVINGGSFSVTENALFSLGSDFDSDSSITIGGGARFLSGSDYRGCIFCGHVYDGISHDNCAVEIGSSTFTFDGPLSLFDAPFVTDKVFARGAVARVNGTYYLSVHSVNDLIDAGITSNATVEIAVPETETLDASHVTLSETAYTYDGKAHQPNVRVTNAAGITLDEGSEYSIVLKNKEGGRVLDAPVAANTYTFEVTGLGAYIGTVEKSFTISPQKLSATKATLSATAFAYNGKAKKPAVTVKNAAGTIICKAATASNANVKLSYAAGRTKIGTYKVTITGVGNYTGSFTKTFKVNPAATAVKSLAAGTKSFKVTWAPKTSSAAATGYQIRYSTKSTMASPKTVTVTSYKTKTKTVKSLKAKQKYYVQIRTYKTVNGTKYYSAWSTKKSVTTK